MRNTFVLLAVVIGLAAARPVLAHHSFSAEFDGSKLVELKGTVTKIDWANPHVYFYLDVKDDKGNTANWGCESASPGNQNRRRSPRCASFPAINRSNAIHVTF